MPQVPAAEAPAGLKTASARAKAPLKTIARTRRRAIARTYAFLAGLSIVSGHQTASQLSVLDDEHAHLEGETFRHTACDALDGSRRMKVVSAFADAWPRIAGRRRSFGDVAREHLDDVYRFLLFMTRDRELAEDLTSETFEKALRRWRLFDPRRGSERTWLIELARSTALDHYRSDRRRLRRESEIGAVVHQTAPTTEGLSPELSDALDSLSQKEREVVVLRVVFEFDAGATARMLGISRSACSMRLARALRKLEERLDARAVR